MISLGLSQLFQLPVPGHPLAAGQVAVGTVLLQEAAVAQQILKLTTQLGHLVEALLLEPALLAPFPTVFPLIHLALHLRQTELHVIA